MEAVIKDARTKMSKAVDTLKGEFSRLRTGRATPALLDGIRVEYYGALSPINQVGNISVPDHKMIVIQPWDATVIPAIEKAIIKSDLGLNPQTDGRLIRIPIPDLTDERRKDLVKHIKRLAEESKVVVRNIRRTANETIKSKEKNKSLTEDDSKKGQEQVQKVTNEFIAEIDKSLSVKEKEITQE